MKIHLIFNAHIDPIWLWPWQASLDEILATCRSACDRLDAHPDLTFSRGEAWVYRQIERLDPALFRRITRLIKQGRWEIVGGWWIQPDCNQPSGFAFERQIEEGKRYFLDRFGRFPEIGYNVDSFGHAATLPGYLRAAGQRYYVMMRPQEHEMPLPARLFRWRGYVGGPEVVTFRIAVAYTARELSTEFVQGCLEGIPKGVEDTMCFVGVGDHGGGPTERQIAWLREHWNAFDGHTFVFSTPARYFKAVAKHIPSLPLVTGELQMHAVGCFSVYRPVKTALRRAEHLLDQAERLRAKLSPSQKRDLPDLKEPWRHVLFNQFHDTLGGTCLPSAYPQVLDQIGTAAAAADEVLQVGFRHLLVNERKNPLQRIAIHNPSSTDFDGYVEHEPWRDWQPWTPQTHLIDATGRQHPFQRVLSEAVVEKMGALFFPVRIAAGKTVIFRIAETGKPAAIRPGAFVSGTKLRNNRKVSVETAPGWRLSFGDRAPLRPILQLIDDPSDTWSHGVRRYGAAVAEAVWEKPELVESGPLRAALIQAGRIGESRLRAEWRLHANTDYAELLLRVSWSEQHKLLKLTLPLPSPATKRIDGILGGTLVRPSDGRELPLRDWTQIACGKGAVGVVTPDVFALDGDEKEIRLTLLRSSLLAHHDPQPAVHPRGTVADQCEHLFRFRFFHGKADVARLERHALLLQQPLLCADLTHGMPTRFTL
jgi:alpha-mannosidase